MKNQVANHFVSKNKNRNRKGQAESMRKTKIVCTLGPSTKDEQVLRDLMLNGMSVARINFSHGTHEEHRETIRKVKEIRKQLNLPVALLLDTKGPEIRLGNFENGRIELKKGQTFVLTSNDVMGNENMVSITYKNLMQDVGPGNRILIDDGLIGMEVLSVTDTDIVCRVLNPGVISNHKGVNVPNVELSMPYISEKDYSDIVFGIENEFDFIAASFTRSADDIMQIKKILHEHGCSNINIIAKIENMQGVENIDEIIRVTDGIMVARGDMGVEIPLEEVPIIQKVIIKKACNAGKRVITATQMLDSMMKNPRPTRAEATDVANAIYDGTSAIMLSGETAAGLYPIEALKTMDRIARRTEMDIDYEKRFRERMNADNPDITNAISHATCMTAMDLNAAAIITVTKSGSTARMISKYRPSCPIIGCSPEEHVCRQMNLSWGVQPLLIAEENDTDELFDHAVDAAEQAGYISAGEIAVLTAGVPLGISGTTNLIKVHVAGHVLLHGKGLNGKKVCSNLCVCETVEELQKNFKPGSIIVVKDTTNEMIPQLKEAGAIIAEEAGMNSHAAVVGLSLDIPVILGAANATKILKSGAVVTVDGETGIVSYSK